MQRRTRKRLAAMSGKINALKGQLKRVLALALCVAIVLPLAMVVKSVQAGEDDDTPYIYTYERQADPSTMDSYIQASLGGYVVGNDDMSTYVFDARTAVDEKYVGDRDYLNYLQNYLASLPADKKQQVIELAKAATISNNYGSRYAGEVWADKSVFAKDAASYLGDGETVNLNWDYGTEADPKNYLYLDEYTDGISAWLPKTDENGNLVLDEDGNIVPDFTQINPAAAIELDEDSDFLHVYSLLGSTQQTLGQTPLDLVMVLDVSASMGKGGFEGNNFNYYYQNSATTTSYPSTKTANAKNNDISKALADLDKDHKDWQLQENLRSSMKKLLDGIYKGDEWQSTLVSKDLLSTVYIRLGGTITDAYVPTDTKTGMGNIWWQMRDQLEKLVDSESYDEHFKDITEDQWKWFWADYIKVTFSKITQSIRAMNKAIDRVLKINEYNRVGVIVFSSHAAEVIPLDHYKYKENGEYIWVTQVENSYSRSEAYGSPYYFFNIETFYTRDIEKQIIRTCSGESNTGDAGRDKGSVVGDTHVLGFYTNMDAGFWAGLNMLAKQTMYETEPDANDGIIVGDVGEEICRRPAFIFLGDGDPNGIMDIGVKNTDAKWWAPPDPLDAPTFWGSNNQWYNSATIVTGTIMRAALMKAAVDKNYKMAAEKANRGKGAENKDDISLGFYTVGVVLGDLADSRSATKAESQAVSKAILNPGEYFYQGEDKYPFISDMEEDDIDEIWKYTRKSDNKDEARYGDTLPRVDIEVLPEHLPSRSVNIAYKAWKYWTGETFVNINRTKAWCFNYYNITNGFVAGYYDFYYNSDGSFRIYENVYTSAGDRGAVRSDGPYYNQFGYNGQSNRTVGAHTNDEYICINPCGDCQSEKGCVTVDDDGNRVYKCGCADCNCIIVTKGELIAVMEEEDDDGNTVIKGYTDDFLNADNAEMIPEILEALVEWIADPTWVPLGDSANAANVKGSLTYTDPIGDYMQVDDVTDVTMFGKRYDVEKYGVYDHSVNEEIVKNTEYLDETNHEYIKEGWYSEKQVEKNGETVTEYVFEGDRDKYSDGWERGYIYRITYATAMKLVSTLPDPDDDTTKEDLSDKQKNTTYTIYQITNYYNRDGNPANSKDLDWNPNWKNIHNDSYNAMVSTDYTDFNTDDIHIWVEDTGDYYDQIMNDFILDTGYSKALFIDIPTPALPLQKIVVELNGNGGVGEITDNLNKTDQSTPLRVYYSVSFNDDYKVKMTTTGDDGKDIVTYVGIDLTKISSEYLENHLVDNIGDDSGRRQVYFLSNYYSGDAYEYPVPTALSAVEAQGNPVVTFVPGSSNQFYLFQENNLLYLIPGSYDDDTRPSDIALGDLSEVYKDKNADRYYRKEWDENGKRWIYRDIRDEKQTYGGENPENNLEKLSSADYQTLLDVLNYMRKTSNDGEPTPYWAFGNCEIVDEGSLSATDIRKMYRDRMAELGNTPVDMTNFDKFQKNLGNTDEGLNTGKLINQPKIASENWYYIIRAYYYTDENEFQRDEDGEVKRDKNGNEIPSYKCCYMAIPRKGSELGSGVGSGSAEYVCWYAPDYHPTSADYVAHPNISNTWNHFVKNSVIDYNKPKWDEWKDPDKKLNDPKGEFPNYPYDEKGEPLPNADPSYGQVAENGKQWYIATKMGGLRVGGLSNFIGTKGYTIRNVDNDGKPVTEEDENGNIVSKTPATVQKNNPTRSADNYFLPTISHASGTDVKVNIFLGNNGRIVVDDSLLLVTKTVSSVSGVLNDGQQGENFTYQVQIKGYTGTRNAVVVTRDEFDRSQWRRRFQSIDVLTDNENLLLDASNDRVKVNIEEIDNNGQAKLLVNEHGELILDPNKPAYYVYVDTNIHKSEYGDKALRVFEADEWKTNEDGTRTPPDLYGTQTDRGGRNYYVGTSEDPNDWEAEAAERQAAHDDAYPDSAHKIFFKAADELHEAGDREYWINMVYLVPADVVDRASGGTGTQGSGWKWNASEANGKGVNWQDAERSPSTITLSSASVGGSSYPCYKIEKFVVATLRTTDKSGNTSDTDLIATTYDSNGKSVGFGLRSSVMTQEVNFDKDGLSEEFFLSDGDGLLFSGIEFKAWYTVTEKMTKDQAGGNIQLQEVSHVEDKGIRTDFYYDNPDNNNGNVGDESDDSTDSPNIEEGEFEGAPIQPSKENVGVKNCYYSFIGDDKEEQEKHLGSMGEGEHKYDNPDTMRHYYLTESGEGDPNYTVTITANFKEEVDDARYEKYYTIIGDTGATEEAVHYVNRMPDIKKVEFDPGVDKDDPDKNASVYVGSLIDYAIRWENFEYSVQLGEPVAAWVEITDPLDRGVDFVSAKFNPFHGNIYDTNDDKFNESDYNDSKGSPGLRDGAGETKEFTLTLTLDASLYDEEKGVYQKTLCYPVPDGNAPSVEPWEPSGDAPGGSTSGGDAAGGGSSGGKGVDYIEVTLTYDPVDHVVTWLIDEAPAGALGYLELEVKVNSSAVRWWNDYEEPEDPEDKNKPDYKVINRATVRSQSMTGNTEIIENPTGEPRKTETSPGPEMQVAIGSRVDYSIDWTNYQPNKADVIIKDHLDPGVYFFEASITGDEGADGMVNTVTLDMSSVSGGDSDAAALMGTAFTLPWDEVGTEEETADKMVADEDDGSEEATDKATPDGDVGPEEETTDKAAPDEEDGSEGEADKAVPDGDVASEEEEADKEVTDGNVEPEEEADDKTVSGGNGGWAVSYGSARHGITLVGVTVSDGNRKPEERTDDETVSGGNNIIKDTEGKEDLRGKEDAGGNHSTEGKGDTKGKEDEEASNVGSGDTGTEVMVISSPAAATVSGGDVSGGDALGYDYHGKSEKDSLTVRGTVTLDNQKEKLEVEVIITYNPATHTITWELKGVPELYSGKVNFSVYVNEYADYEWEPEDDYDPDCEHKDPNDDHLKPGWDPDGNNKDPNMDEADNRIYNRGMVKVGDDAWLLTDIIENPTKPEKTERIPGEGVEVEIGRNITYYITWLNKSGETADVTITDKLDPGVDYVEAGFLKLKEDGSDYDIMPPEEWEDDWSVEPVTDGEGKVTVTWILPNRPSGGSGSAGMVYLTVKVNDRAQEGWDYTDEERPGEIVPDEENPEDRVVVNKAGITVKNETEYTNRVENPVKEPTPPEKEAIDPKEGELVGVGDKITYTISWENDAYEDGKGYVESPLVTITDQLDPGVTFYEAGFMEWSDEAGDYVRGGGWRWNAEEETWGRQGELPEKCEIEYDTDGHTVIWKLYDRPADGPDSAGKVYLTVIVNRDARYEWDYTDRKDPGKIVPGGDGDDDMVYNKARVKVENGSNQFTKKVRHPVDRDEEEEFPGPKKEESYPGADRNVKVDDEITYTITWRNDAYDYTIFKYMASTVIVIDKLDPGVDFVSAGFLDEDGEPLPSWPEGCSVTDTRDEDGNVTVTWTLENREAKAAGQVYLVVKVNEKAYDDWHYKDETTEPDFDKWGDVVAGGGRDDKVVNKARVIVVENDNDQYTDVVENPVVENPVPEKPTGRDVPDNQDDIDEMEVPKTGDDSQLGLWLALLGLCLIGLTVIMSYTVKKKTGRLDRIARD